VLDADYHWTISVLLLSAVVSLSLGAGMKRRAD
jgi:hypothetical protein